MTENLGMSAQPPADPTPSRVVYRAPLRVAVQGIGVGGMLLGGALIGVVIISALDAAGALRAMMLTAMAIAALGGLLVFSVGILRVLGFGARLVLEEDGFHNATGPRAGVRRVSWKDVRKVQADGPVVSVDLGGNRRSLIRTQALQVQPKDLARELRARLNADRGYRPLGS